MKHHKTLILTLVLIITATLITSCSNVYKKGVDYDDFPDKDVPIYDDAIVFSFVGEDDEYELEYGSEDDVDDIMEFYRKEFEDKDYTITDEKEEKDEYSVEGIIGDIEFEIEVEEASRKEAEYYDTIVTITVKAVAESKVEADSKLSTLNQEWLTNENEYLLLKDVNHNIIKSFEGNGQISAHAILPSSNGFIIIGGTSLESGPLKRVGTESYTIEGYDLTGPCLDVFIAEFNINGDILWKNIFPTKLDDYSQIFITNITNNDDKSYTFEMLISEDELLNITINEHGEVVSNDTIKNLQRLQR